MPFLSATAPAVAYEGRVQAEPSGEVRLGFPGVTARLRFRGSRIELHAWASSDDACFDVAIDEGPAALLRLKAGEGTYRLANGLTADREHTLTLVRRTESWQGVCSMHGFAVPSGGEWLTPTMLPSRRLLFIGDSVTCGEMAGWTPDAVPSAIAHNNARCSYGMLLARRLGAQCHLVSYGGRGLIRDWRGIREIPNAPQFYEFALPDDPCVRWDHCRYVPDAVGIQLGTNDFNQGTPDEDEFVNAYLEFLRKIRRDAPAAAIVVMESPILNDDGKGPQRTTFRRYLDSVIRIAADNRVICASLRHCPGVPGNGHPTRAEHIGMADELEPVFRRVLGW